MQSLISIVKVAPRIGRFHYALVGTATARGYAFLNLGICRLAWHWTELLCAPHILHSMSICDEMNSRELEDLAIKLHAQIERSSRHSEMPRVAVEDVKRWIALHKKESESCLELSFFLNLV